MSLDENNNSDSYVKSSVVKEQVKPKFKKKLKKFFGVLFLTIFAAVVFGVVARFVFIKSEDTVLKILGIEKDSTPESNPKIEINLSGNGVNNVVSNDGFTSPTVAPTVVVDNDKPLNLATPVETKNPEVDPVISPTPENSNPTGNVDGGNTKIIEEDNKGDSKDDKFLVDSNTSDAGNTGDNTEISQGQTSTSGLLTDGFVGISVSDYIGMMDELHELTDKINTGIVTVKAMTSTVNWMGDDMETTIETFGGYFADNGYDYLFVTYYDKIMNADSLKVVLCNGNEYKANLYERDNTYNLAVVAVPVRIVSKDDQEILNKLVFCNSHDIYAGMPVIAMGSPNGCKGSLEYGFVTSSDNKYYVVDGELSIFTTDITNSDQSEGIIVDYAGEVVGVITRTLDIPQKRYASSSISIDSIAELIIEMCNGHERPLVGVRAENIPKDALKDLERDNGIYVNDVMPGSPAEDAGIRKGDIIVQINGEDINSVAEFMKKVVDSSNENGIELTVYRSTRISTPEFKVTVVPKRK